ncbi:MAG: methylmalonyl Co-A mutase-associated GTPase MeaB [bacterium]|nr:methylmalonyl Co-A mutase-associated GTPase MeaB [bacterium]
MKQLDQLVRNALKRDPLALGRIARILDDGLDGRDEVLSLLYPRAGRARVVGITGPPGAGKSTLVSGLIGHARAKGLSVAVLAVDPTSPYSGGAVLGDRIRMQEHATDPGVFIRSLATRGNMGGLSRTAGHLLTLMDAAGFDLVFLETVGVGQEEVQIKDLAQTTVFVTVPGLGDGIQAMKAGVLEIAHIYLVNKADIPMVEATVRDLKAMVSLGGGEGEWEPPVLTSVAKEGVGIGELMNEIDRHYDRLEQSGGLDRWRAGTAGAAVTEALKEIMESSLSALVNGRGREWDEDVRKVATRESDPLSVARRWLARLDFNKD